MAPRRLVPPPDSAGEKRAVKCGRCGAVQQLTIPPNWDRRGFVQTYCTKCSYRFFLPTKRLGQLRILAFLCFVACMWFVIHTILQQR
jgi:hypothetical protein